MLSKKAVYVFIAMLVIIGVGFFFNRLSNDNNGRHNDTSFDRRTQTSDTENEKDVFTNWWESYRESNHLRDSWNTTINEGIYPVKGLLDTSEYPNGPQLCYTFGTDVR